jgi:trans-aconitate 2-methyltransferase
MSDSMSGKAYLFGDNDVAAQRLSVLGEVFKQSTRAFLTRMASSGPARLAIDLGCGLGSTTHLIAETSLYDQVLGLDTSASFIALARARATPRMLFALHDVTTVPFPTGLADLIFCRFLLTHLSKPHALVADWASQLRPGGMLLIEEAENIRTTRPVFLRYIEIVDAMLANQSNRLFAGPLLAALDIPAGLELVQNELCSLPVRSRDAAKMFSLNLSAWKDREFIRSNYSSVTLVEIEQALMDIAHSDSDASEITWEMRQMAWRRE